MKTPEEVLEQRFERIFKFLYIEDMPEEVEKEIRDHARYFFFGGFTAAMGEHEFDAMISTMEEAVRDAEVRTPIISTDGKLN